MKKCILPLTAALLLTGCARPRYNPQPTVEQIEDFQTLPTFQYNETPQQKLEAALHKVERPFTLIYGTRWEAEDLTALEVDAQTDLTPVKSLFPNGNCVADFCALGPVAIPSNTGSYSYQLNSLTLEEACRLITGRAPTEEELAAASVYERIEGYATITVDPQGRFRELSVELDLYGEERTTYQRLIAINYPLS